MSYIREQEIRKVIKRALVEDVGRDDITTKLLFPGHEKIEAAIIAGEKGIVCGIKIAWLVFKLWDNNIKFRPLVKDGRRIKRGQILARVYGSASSILSVERVSLNFLGLLSGIATRTNKFVDKIKKTGVKIMDTRKTIPGLRTLQKYAVRVGGGRNHRFRLDEMVLIKDNHFIASFLVRGASCVEEIIKKIKNKKPKNLKLEIEVKSLREFKEALKAKPDIIMLDNMSASQIKRAIKIRNNLKPKTKNLEPKVEASGNINLENIRDYARTGVDFISLGTLTKDVRSLDLSLEINKGGR